jgi:hypothetical protein
MRFGAHADAHSTLMLAVVAEEKRMQRKGQRAPTPWNEEDLRLQLRAASALGRFAPA